MNDEENAKANKGEGWIRLLWVLSIVAAGVLFFVGKYFLPKIGGAVSAFSGFMAVWIVSGAVKWIINGFRESKEGGEGEK